MILDEHLLGKEASVTLVRDGMEVASLYNSTYDFDYQIFYMYSEPVEWRPGDALQIRCVYDTSHKNAWTFGGDWSEQEMCTFL